jgi:hypothetical protein
MFLRKRLVPGEIGTGLFCLRCWLSERGRGNDPQENEPWGEVAKLLLRVLLECSKPVSGHRYTNLPDDGFEVLAENSIQAFAEKFRALAGRRRQCDRYNAVNLYRSISNCDAS